MAPVDFFADLYGSIRNKYKIFIRLRFYSFLRFVIRVTSYIWLYFYFKVTQNNKNNSLNLNKSKTGERIIVSLTSFPERIKNVWLVIESILRQTKKPDRIILYLSKKQFSDETLLPKSLTKLKRRGLEIMFVDEDFRSHKKYLYTLLKYPNDNMITIDDDIFYRSDMIEKLYQESIQNPSTVVAQYCRKIMWKDDGRLETYDKWFLIDKETNPCFAVFFGSGGGVLFPPKVLYVDTTNENLFMKLCPTADDIWLNAMCQLNNIKVKKINCGTSFLPIVVYFKSQTLSSINYGSNMNDYQLIEIIEYYKKVANKNLFDRKNDYA